MVAGFKQFDLTGKTALVTGGAGMLGREHAMALLECGASVILTDINHLDEAADAIDQSADRISYQIMDVTDPQSIRNCAEIVSGNKQRIDILINNAAIDPKVKEGETIASSRFENFSLEQWNHQLAVGLTGPFLSSQVFGTAMANDGKGGVILNIALI